MNRLKAIRRSGCAIAATVILVSCADTSSSAEYEERLANVQATVADAGFDVAQPFIDVSSCSTDEECVDAGDALVAGLQTYNPTIRAQITELEKPNVPEKYHRLNALYLEQLRLRVEAGEMIIEGWEASDDELLNDGFLGWQEAQAKLSEIVDELGAIEEER